MALHRLTVSNPQKFGVGRATQFFEAGCKDKEVMVSDYRVREVTSCSHLKVKDHGPVSPEELAPTAPETSEGDTENLDRSEEPDATDGAKKAAADAGISLSEVAGTGKDGRITKDDVDEYVEANS